MPTFFSSTPKHASNTPVNIPNRKIAINAVINGAGFPMIRPMVRYAKKAKTAPQINIPPHPKAAISSIITLNVFIFFLLPVIFTVYNKKVRQPKPAHRKTQTPIVAKQNLTNTKKRLFHLPREFAILPNSLLAE